MSVKDIDFDELDRAVNSAIAKNQSKPSDYDDSSLSSISETALDIISDIDMVRPLPMPKIPPPRPSKPIAKRPNKGRFLDMVHGSSGKRKRQHKVVKPDFSMPQVAKTNFSVTHSAPMMTTMQSQNLQQHSVANISQLMNDTKPTPKPVVLNTNMEPMKPLVDLGNFDRAGNPIDKTLGVKLGDPQDTPFLPDTKVEKRPLNSMKQEEKILLHYPMSHADRKNMNTPLPAELDSDLLTIEANEVAKNLPEIEVSDAIDHPVSPSIESAAENISPVVTPESQRNVLQEPINLEDEQTQSETRPLVSNSLVVNSIPQQYEEKPSSVKHDSGAIYDVNNYHKAAVTVKKKSGWSWVVWTIILMIASVGAGVAVYFLVLPQM